MKGNRISKWSQTLLFFNLMLNKSNERTKTAKKSFFVSGPSRSGRDRNGSYSDYLDHRPTIIQIYCLISIRIVFYLGIVCTEFFGNSEC